MFLSDLKLQFENSRIAAQLLNWLSMRLPKLLALATLVSSTVAYAESSLSSIFMDANADGIDDRVAVYMRLSAKTGETKKLASLTTNQELMVDPTVDTDGDGVRDFLEVYGYYVDGTSIRGLKQELTGRNWEAFKDRPSVDNYPVYTWAAEAIEESALIRASDNPGEDNEELLLDVSEVYLPIYNKFILNGMPATHRLITGSPTELGTIASIIAEFISVYPSSQPKINDQLLQVYYTDPLLRSSDWDPYSDRDEVLGLFGASVPKVPANDPLIGAIPNITAQLENYVLTEIQELRETDGTTTNHTDVIREVNSTSQSHGISASASYEYTGGTGGVSHSWEIGATQSNSWSFGHSTQTEDRDSFGTMEQSSTVTSTNCFAKLQLTLKLTNIGSDKAAAIYPRLYVTIGDTLWQTVNGSDQLGNGYTLKAGESDEATVLGQEAGDAACLTLEQANFVSSGGTIGIGTELESAEIGYLDQDSGVIFTDGNWAYYKDNYEENLAKIDVNVFTTDNVEINRTFWIRAYDESESLPNMRQSVKEVLEKAYTPVSCDSIGYLDKTLCLATEYDGYILLGDGTDLNFRFFDDNSQPLGYEDSYAAYLDLTMGIENPLDIYLPRRSIVSIVDVSSRAPEFPHMEVISKTNQELEVRATVSDYFGIDTVQFCKTEGDCVSMNPALPDQPEKPASGYYKLVLENHTLQGTEYLQAANVVGNITKQTPTTFYLGLFGASYETIDTYDAGLKKFEEWLAYLAVIQSENTDLYNEILDYDLMDTEGAMTLILDTLLKLLGDAKGACAYTNPLPLGSAQDLLAQKTLCDNAVMAYEQALIVISPRIYNPYKMPLKNNLVVNNKGVSNTMSSNPDAELSCDLGDLDIVTGIELNYDTGPFLSQNIGARLYYRTIERSNLSDPLFQWSGVKNKKCGNLDAVEKSWIDKKDDLADNTTINALVDFGWSVKSGNVNRFCSIYRTFDLSTAKFGTNYGEYCSGTTAWSGIEAFSNGSAYKPGSSPGPVSQSLNDLWLNAKLITAQETYARHFTYELDYQSVPEHNLVHGQEYRIRANNDKLLTLKGAQAASRSLALEANNGQDDQIWVVDIVNDREFRLRPKSFDGFLSRPNVNGDAGDNVSVLATASDDDNRAYYNQHWRITRSNDNSYGIVSVVNLKSLSSDDLLLHSSSILPEVDQSWNFDPVVNVSYKAGKAYNIDHHFAEIHLGQTFSVKPLIFADMQTFNGEDPAGVRIKDVSVNRFQAKIEEELSSDGEYSHAHEALGFLAVEPGMLVDASGKVIGETGSLSVAQSSADQWFTLNLNNSYQDPVVIMMMNSFGGEEPSHVRLRTESNSVTEYQIEEWDYLDGGHATESVAYLVVEAGTHTLASGQILQAFTANADHTWASVPFNPAFFDKPVVLSQSQTYSGAQAVVTRHDAITDKDFKLRLHEEEGGDGAHTWETVGVIAIGK